MNQCFTDGGGGGGGGGFLTPHPDVTKTSDFKTDDGQVGGATAVCPEATLAAEGPEVSSRTLLPRNFQSSQRWIFLMISVTVTGWQTGL